MFLVCVAIKIKNGYTLYQDIGDLYVKSFVNICHIPMLIEPVALADFFLSFFSAAMIILLGALYAGLFAWAKITSQYRFRLGAGFAYLALLVTVIIFSQINHFNGYWLTLSFLMVVGYGCMPYAIWRLCAATHADESEHSHHSGG